MTVINVGKEMRTQTRLRVSKGAEAEMTDFLKDLLLHIVHYAEKEAGSNGTKTILEEHIVSQEHRQSAFAWVRSENKDGFFQKWEKVIQKEREALSQ